ncbi:MAG TPA: hypothetical protein VGP55_00510 [Chitinophagaceae bacterium]|nr:hypothetical protein [Chitinophagaceae bacterium]
MNERLPYEEQLLKQWNDLQLPDENFAWEDMKRRLEKDNDKVIIPPAKNGCFIFGLLFMFFAVLLFFIVRPDKWVWNKKEQKIDSTELLKSIHKDVSLKNKTTDSQKNIAQPGRVVISPKGLDSATNKSRKEIVNVDSLFTVKKKVLTHKKLFLKRNNGINTNIETYSNRILTTTNNKDQNNNAKKNKRINKNFTAKLESKISTNDQSLDSTITNEENLPGKTGTLQNEQNVKPDSISTNITDSILKKETKKNYTTSKIVKQDSAIKKQIYFAAGLALHQQVPIDGQKLVPYNSLGRKGTLADYVPSIYFRMYKDKNWFIQTEFRYGAPQTTKQIIYKQQKLVDTFNNTTLTSSTRLRKTYYHQLPVSFDYFILPGVTIGAGLTWNRFSNAILDQEVKLTNNITSIDSFKTNTIVHSQKTDSNFVKSYFQGLFEIQYEWKRFSVGSKYSFGLQPYIKFQLPGGERREEKNSSLQLYIRYNLWESKKAKSK